MKLISARTSKRLPIIAASAGMIGIIAVAIVPTIRFDKAAPNPMVFIPLLVFIPVSIFLWKLFSSLADEVWDDGNALVIKFKDKQERIPLSEIINVNYSGLTNPPRATLTLRNATRFGKEIAFIPQRAFSLNPLAKNEMIEGLIRRIDEQRRR